MSLLWHTESKTVTEKRYSKSVTVTLVTWLPLGLDRCWARESGLGRYVPLAGTVHSESCPCADGGPQAFASEAVSKDTKDIKYGTSLLTRMQYIYIYILYVYWLAKPAI